MSGSGTRYVRQSESLFGAYGLVVGVVAGLHRLFGLSGAPLAAAAAAVAVVLFWGGLRPVYRRVDSAEGE